VEVLQSGETASHVFQGKVVVKVAGAGAEGRGTGDINPESPNPRTPNPEVVLSAGQSARVERDGVSELYLMAASESFVRSMPHRKKMATFNTGVGLQEGDQDTHWQVAARSDDSGFKPTPAVVTPAVNPDCYRPNEPGQSQWISLTGGAAPLPDDVVYTFQTKFNLSSLVAKSAVLRGQFMADDHVRAVRLNGHEVALPNDRSVSPSLHWDQFVITEGFIEGENTLEVDVLNRNSGLRPNASNTSLMAVRVELEGFYSSMSAASDMKSTGEKKEAMP
jgi:hypothetical protein